MISKSAYHLREQQIEFNREGEYPHELLDFEGKNVLLKVKVKSSDYGYDNTTFQVVKLSVDQSEIERFREQLIEDSTSDTAPAANSLTSLQSIGNDVQMAITSSETVEHEVMPEPFTPVPKRPLSVAVDDHGFLLFIFRLWCVLCLGSIASFMFAFGST